MQELDLNAIVKYPFPADQYFATETPKSQIYLHHTAGNANGPGVFDGWKSNDDKIGTAVAICGDPGKNGKWKDGQIVQGFSSKFWAYHLGLKQELFKQFGVPYQSLDKISIGIEICNWGQLTKTDRGWTTYVNTIVPDSQVVEYKEPFRGFAHYHKYTDAQIESVRQLLVFWNKSLGIPIKYKGDEIFNLDKRAFAGEAGVYTHCSVRKDKVDIHPQPNMIQMLKSL